MAIMDNGGGGDETPRGVPSPFSGREPQADFIKKILKHLDHLRVPILTHHLGGKCSRDCHLIERNHTVDAVKFFIEEGCKEN